MTKSILVVGMNPAIDEVTSVRRAMNGTVLEELNGVFPAGKATNCARIFSKLGGSVKLVGFIGRNDLPFFRSTLDEEGVVHEFVPLAFATRRNRKLIDATAGREKEENEYGAPVTTDELHRIDALVRENLQTSSMLVICGSIPPGVPPDMYAAWINAARAAGVPSALDTSGDALTRGIAAASTIVKINRREFAQSTGDEAISDAELESRLIVLISSGIEIAAVTSDDMVLFASSEGIVRLTPPRIDVINPVGAGDAMLASLVRSYLLNEPLRQMYDHALKSAAAACRSLDPGACAS